MNQVSEWSGYDKPESVFVFEVDGVWLPAYVSVVAASEHLARSLLFVHINNAKDGTKAQGNPPLVAVLPVNKTCAVTIWNGDY